MDLFWPQDIVPNSIQWRVVDNTAVFPSPLSGTNRTVSRPGMRLGCTIQVNNVKGAVRHRMAGLIASLRGRANRIWLVDEATRLRGSFPGGELIGNSVFESTAGWTSSNAELVLTADSGRMRLTRTAVAADRFASTPCVTVSGNTLLFRAGIVQGRSTPSFALQLGTTSTGAELIAGSNLLTAQYTQVSAAATGTTTYATIRDYISGRAADYFQLLEMPSLARCALVMGGSQSGSGLLIDQLPASTVDLLVPGDLVSIYTTQWEMKRVVAGLNSNASGQGYLMFEPALRVSPPDNSPIAIHRPTGRFMLATPEAAWDTVPGLVSSFSLEFVEDLS